MKTKRDKKSKKQQPVSYPTIMWDELEDLIGSFVKPQGEEMVMNIGCYRVPKRRGC